MKSNREAFIKMGSSPASPLPWSAERGHNGGAPGAYVTAADGAVVFAEGVEPRPQDVDWLVDAVNSAEDVEELRDELTRFQGQHDELNNKLRVATRVAEAALAYEQATLEKRDAARAVLFAETEKFKRWRGR